MSKPLILLIVVFYIILPLSITDNLIITLPDGKIQGTTYITQNNNRTYYGFHGIPYASSPIGNLRFEAPQKPEPWSGVLDASRDGKACISIQHWINPKGEDEDCLNINVYTPSITPTTLLPVMLWIYGGSFVAGSSIKSLFGPDFIVEENVIVVTFNYRLGPFGFLSTGDTSIRGNAGLKDQNLAMRWTHQNIGLFGGDREKITIFGQSAGGASAGLHLLSSQSAGLFRAAILQSGSALSYWAIDPDPKSYAILLADTLAGGSFNKNDTQLVKTFLINQTTEALINASIILLFERQQQVWPTLEVEHEDAFITESPYELIRTGRFNKVPIITGICSEESLMFLKDLDYATRLASWYESEHSRLIPSNLYANTSDENAVVSAVRSIYLKDEENFTENMAAFANLFSDTGFTRSVIKFAELSSSFVPVYLYQFAYYGRVLWPAFIDDAERVAHAAELPFIWNMAGVSDTTNSDDILTQNRMIKLWTNFAKFLNPTPEETKLFSNLTWPTITPSNQRFLNINHTVEIRTNLRNESYSKWNDIYESYGKKPLITY